MSNGTQRTTLEQGRAAFAYKCAEEGAKLDKKKEYKSYVKKMPMLIKTNGLGAAIAFAYANYAKGIKNGKQDTNNAWGLLYSQVEDWILKDEKRLIEFPKNDFAKSLTETTSPIYRAVTIEVLALLSWIKRFAEALIEEEAE